MGIVVITGCGDIPGWMLRGVGFCEVPEGGGRCEVPRGWDVVRFPRGRYINMSIFVDF